MFNSRRKIYRLKTDEELVEIYSKDLNKECIGIIYERYGHLVMGVCLKYLKNIEIAEDMTMQIFENLHEKLKKHNITYFKSWLFMVTKNECFMYFRKKGLNLKSMDITQVQEIDQPEIISVQEKELKIQHLEEAIKFLRDDQRICLELFYFKEMSYQQICDELQKPMMHVKSCIQNGKRNLKIRLENMEPFTFKNH
jgi:RNA polymerase sigma-70 factor (ECF subfamily)